MCRIYDPPPENRYDPAIRVIGTFSVRSASGGVLRFPTRRTRDLLAYLLCFHERRTGREEILARLFPGPDPGKAHNNLYVTMHRLRGLLAGADIMEGGLVFRTDGSLQIGDGICDYVDLRRFMRANAVIRDDNAARALQLSRGIRGGLLDGIDTGWATETRLWFLKQCERLMLQTAAHETAHGRVREAEEVLTLLMGLDGYAEPAYLALMDLYMERGDNEAFRRIYTSYRQVMVTELDLAPEPKYAVHAARVGIMGG